MDVCLELVLGFPEVDKVLTRRISKSSRKNIFSEVAFFQGAILVRMHTLEEIVVRS